MMGTYKTPHILCDMNEASSALMMFIGGEKYKEITQTMEDREKSGFLLGLSFALSLMMSRGRTYLYHVDETPQKDGDGDD